MTKEESYKKYKNIIKSVSCRWQISQELICALIFQESKFEQEKQIYDDYYYKKYINKYNIPADEKKWRATHIGLIQLTGQHAREIGYREYKNDFIDPVINLYFGFKYFLRLLNRFKKVEDTVIAFGQRCNGNSKIKDESGNYYNRSYLNNIVSYLNQFKAIIEENTLPK